MGEQAITCSLVGKGNEGDRGLGVPGEVECCTLEVGHHCTSFLHTQDGSGDVVRFSRLSRSSPEGSDQVPCLHCREARVMLASRHVLQIRSRRLPRPSCSSSLRRSFSAPDSSTGMIPEPLEATHDAYPMWLLRKVSRVPLASTPSSLHARSMSCAMGICGSPSSARSLDAISCSGGASV